MARNRPQVVSDGVRQPFERQPADTAAANAAHGRLAGTADPDGRAARLDRGAGRHGPDTALRGHLAARIRDTRQPDATADDQSGTEVAEVMLAALVGYASLVAAGFDVAPATFQRTLERLLDPSGP